MIKLSDGLQWVLSFSNGDTGVSLRIIDVTFDLLFSVCTLYSPAVRWLFEGDNFKATLAPLLLCNVAIHRMKASSLIHRLIQSNQAALDAAIPSLLLCLERVTSQNCHLCLELFDLFRKASGKYFKLLSEHRSPDSDYFSSLVYQRLQAKLMSVKEIERREQENTLLVCLLETLCQLVMVCPEVKQLRGM